MSKKHDDTFKKARTMVITCYDLEAFKVPDDHPSFRYCVYQVEVCPTTEALHIQGYAEFNATITLLQARELFGNSQIRFGKRCGTAVQARHYCMCPGPDCPEDDISPEYHPVYKQSKIVYAAPIEFGTWTGKSGKQGRRTDLISFVEDIKAGLSDADLIEKHPVAFLQHGHRVANMRLAIPPVLRDHPQVVIIWGSTGQGKTHKVYAEHDIKDICKLEGTYRWFNGYTGQKVVIFDEYYGQFELPYFLQLLDKYPTLVGTKGSFVTWKPTHIYITCNESPRTWYPNATKRQLDALSRRITDVIRLTGREVPPPKFDISTMYD